MEIELNKLPNYTKWVNRLLGLEEWVKPCRNLEKIDSEWEQDKYYKLLKAYEEKRMGMEEVKRIDIAGDSHRKDYPIIWSEDNEIMTDSSNTASALRRYVLMKYVLPFLSDTNMLVELGCGYGYNLWYLREVGVKLIGGDYSNNAVKLGRELLKGYPDIKLETFNFYDEEWEILEKIEEPVVILTSHSIEQLPTALPALSTLRRYKNKIKRVIHLEPAYESYDTTLLGLLRKSYTIANDYNTDLLSSISKVGGYIEKADWDIPSISLNPLNPTSRIVWSYLNNE